MAPKPVVPADFGIENLYSELHGNIVVKLENNAEMKANSMILSMNSPVFGDIFRNLEIRTVDMDDFSGAAVKVFLESLYTGEVILNKEIFRDINKMGNVFKVTWLISRCEGYFDDLVQTANGYDYESLLFVFEESRFLKNSVKKPKYLDIVLEKLTVMANRETVNFIERYMANYRDFAFHQLNLMICIAGENVHIIMKVIKQNMIEHGINFDENTKYLLQHVDLVKCLETEHHIKLYEEVFDMLFEKAENVSTRDVKMLVKLYREAATECRLKKRRKIESGTQLALVRDIPNMLHNVAQFNGLTTEQCVDILITSIDVKNLHMFFEVFESGLSKSNLWQHLTADKLQKLIQRKQTQGWCAVQPAFLDNLLFLTKTTETGSSDIFARLKCCEELVSTTADSVRIVCDEHTNLKDLVLEENMYKFYFRHPQISPCSNPTQCGFIVSVSPVSKEKTGLFNMQLVIDPAMYPAEIIHYHDSVISVENMHMVIEVFSKTDNKWFNVSASWWGTPEYNVIGELYWGQRPLTSLKNSSTVRLALYYNLTQ